MTFELNGITWTVVTVHPNDPCLIDRTGCITLATTDPMTCCIYISNVLRGTLKKRVIAHEMGHATCFSFGLLSDIHNCCYPWKQVEMEEFICNFVADYGERIFDITYRILGDSALGYLPVHLESVMLRR